MVRSKTRRSRHFLAPLIVGLALASWVLPAAGVTTLEGYTSLMAELRNSGGGDPSWGLGNPQLYAEFRLKSTPWRDIDSFLKVSAESNRRTDRTVDGVEERDVKETKFFFREAHVRFHANRFETHLFSGQDRFWLNEPLLQIVDSGQVKHDDYGPRAQGIRLDFWDTYGFSGAAFISERSDYGAPAAWDGLSEDEQAGYPGSTVGDSLYRSTDDYRGFRVNRSMFSENVRFGSTYARKDYNTSAYLGNRANFDETVAVDVELALGDMLPGLSRFGRVTWVTETGRTSSGHLWDDKDPEVNGFKTELRDIRMGPLRFLGAWETYGEHFYNQGLASGDRQNLNDYTQYYVEGHYRVPTKAVNLKGWVLHAEPEHVGSTSFAETDGTIDEWGSEVYIEFLNGFTGKAEYKVKDYEQGVRPNLFMELTGENRLVKLRTQFRIKDIDYDHELTAYGFEANVNLSDVWKFYARVLNVDEVTESRQTVFAQLRYLGWNSAEFFVEFGNPDHSNDLVNDDWDFVVDDDTDAYDASNRTTEQVFKAFVRIYY